MSPPKAWRILKAKYATRPLSGMGAQKTGGRWNEKGTPAVYTAETLALSTLEVCVHAEWDFKHVKLVRVGIHWPESLRVDSIKAPLPRNWDQVPHGPDTMALGNAWILSNHAAILRVPSAIVPNSFNFILNPSHPEFKKIGTNKPDAFAWDEQMWKDRDN